jgi:hypothetical protein
MGLTPNTDYIWKVQSVCSKTPLISSDYSGQKRFTTAPLRLFEGTPVEEVIGDVYPNPVHNQFTINMSIPTSEVTIRVFDLQGKMIDLPTTLDFTQVQINTTALPKGFYTLQITNSKTGIIEVRKFVKQE